MLTEVIFTRDDITLWPSAGVREYEIAFVNAIDQSFSGHSPKKNNLSIKHDGKRLCQLYICNRNGMGWMNFNTAIYFIINSKTIGEHGDATQEF